MVVGSAVDGPVVGAIVVVGSAVVVGSDPFPSVASLSFPAEDETDKETSLLLSSGREFFFDSSTALPAIDTQVSLLHR